MRFHAVAGEEWLVVGIELHVFGVGRHEHFHEVLGFTIGFVAFDQHFIDVLGIKIADGAFDQAAFFVDEAGCF